MSYILVIKEEVLEISSGICRGKALGSTFTNNNDFKFVVDNTMVDTFPKLCRSCIAKVSRIVGLRILCFYLFKKGYSGPFSTDVTQKMNILRMVHS